MPRILIVEDEPSIADTIKYVLTQNNFEIFHALNAQSAIEYCAQNPIDLAILDIGLPDMDGLCLAKILQQKHRFPFFFLTARNDEIDRIIGLEIGADDYITKPFSPRELLARVRVVLRRVQNHETFLQNSKEHLVLTNQSNLIQIDEEKHIIYLNSQKIDFSRTEFDLILHLKSNSERVYSRDQLMAFIWEEPLKSTERTVDTHIKNIRAKFAKIQEDFNPILTIRGVGYRWEIPQVMLP
jgi:two-component system catabolic regulation response regulator CreB